MANEIFVDNGSRYDAAQVKALIKKIFSHDDVRTDGVDEIVDAAHAQLNHVPNCSIEDWAFALRKVKGTDDREIVGAFRSAVSTHQH